MSTDELLMMAYPLDGLCGVEREQQAGFWLSLRCQACGKPGVLGCFQCGVIRCEVDFCPHMEALYWEWRLEESRAS